MLATVCSLIHPIQRGTRMTEDEFVESGHRLYRALAELGIEPDPKFEAYSPSCISRNDFDTLDYPQLRYEFEAIQAILKRATERAARTVYRNDRLNTVKRRRQELERRLTEVRQEEDELKRHRKQLRNLIGPAPPKKKVATARRPDPAKNRENRVGPQPKKKPTKTAGHSQAKSNGEDCDE